MIKVAADLDGMTAQVRADTGNVCPGLIAQHVILKQWFSVFGAKDDVVEKVLVCRHRLAWLVSPAGLGWWVYLTGGLRHRQLMFRPPALK